MVDPSGILFLPNVGPIRVAGIRAGDLQRTVEAEVQKVYTTRCGSTPCCCRPSASASSSPASSARPGRFAGSAADSVLDFLVRAGGVDPGRGSYRDIAVQRGGRTVADVDLYRFLLEGGLPPVRCRRATRSSSPASARWSAPTARCATTTCSRCRAAP